MVTTAVVGHVEWVEFARVERLPRAGEIVQALEWWEEAAGGGADTAVQLAKLSAKTLFFTALGDDERGRRAESELQRRGVDMHVALRDEPTRRAFTHIEPGGERTITVGGERLGPRGSDDLPWRHMGQAAATYFTAGDEVALKWARRSRVLVATARVLGLLVDSGVQLDALVGSGSDPDEHYEPGMLSPVPRLVVMTAGEAGGRYWIEGGAEQRWHAPVMDRPIVDRYGAGDAFAGGLTYALARYADPADAVDFAARCGAAVLTGKGPYEGQLTRAPW